MQIQHVNYIYNYNLACSCYKSSTVTSFTCVIKFNSNEIGDSYYNSICWPPKRHHWTLVQLVHCKVCLFPKSCLKF